MASKITKVKGGAKEIYWRNGLSTSIIETFNSVDDKIVKVEKE